YRRFRQGQPMNPVNQVEDQMSFEISHDHFLIHREEEQQQKKKFIEAINQLPARQKEIIYLKIYQQLSYDEISEVMNINYQVARNLMTQALRSLKKLLLLFAAITFAIAG